MRRGKKRGHGELFRGQLCLPNDEDAIANPKAPLVTDALWSLNTPRLRRMHAQFAGGHFSLMIHA
jgi:hypothetical protein